MPMPSVVEPLGPGCYRSGVNRIQFGGRASDCPVGRGGASVSGHALHHAVDIVGHFARVHGALATFEGLHSPRHVETAG